MRLIVGMTGATGAVFGVRLLEALAALPDVETHLVLSRWARTTVELETGHSVAIASNESFGGWTKTFTDPRLCAAIVDRLTFNGTIIETGTDSYRLASTRARVEEPAKVS
uniref:ATP-binding protein n=1 Tax=Streptomyces sioyaensis TaxID=67364 RepID=UPI0035ABE1E7